MINSADLKKKIIDSLYQSNFYDSLINIKKLEGEVKDSKEVLFLYYYLYDLMVWVSKHRRNSSITEEITQMKNKYFNKILKYYQNDESTTYLTLYLFLDENFNTFERYSWFSKYNKSKELLNLSLKNNPNNIETQFYLLFTEEKTDECITFLQKNTLDNQIVNKFINRYWHKYLNSCYELSQHYGLNTELVDIRYYLHKKDFNWLYNYFNQDNKRKLEIKFISYGKVCFELEKYSEAIDYYEKKEDKNNDDFLILGECYEKLGNEHKNNAITCYQKIDSGFSFKGIERLFNLDAIDEIKYILESKNFFYNLEYKNFYTAKILNIEKKYEESSNNIIGSINTQPYHNKKLIKDIYLLIVDNYFMITRNDLDTVCKRIIETENFELKNDSWLLDYKNYSSYKSMKEYIQKLNIEYENEFLEQTNQLITSLNEFFLDKIKQIYKVAQENEVKLSENRELYYLSAFDDVDSLNKRIKIYENRLNNESENPKHYLALGELFYEKSKLENEQYDTAIKYLNKAINASDKYNVNMNGRAELLLTKLFEGKKKKEFFDKGLNDYIFFNSYQKDVFTSKYFEGILYKYQSFSINALSSLSENYLYFATPSQLNDPFDVASISLEKQFDGLQLDKSDFKLCSLSQNNKNKLMWSHYTLDHTGICVGYKFLYLPSYVGKDEVKYKNTLLDEKDIFKSMLDYWTVKSEDWMYEQEVRLLHYGDKQKISYTFDISEAINKNIIALKIESVIFGLKFENEAILRPIISKIEKDQDSTITVYRVKIENQNLELIKES